MSVFAGLDWGTSGHAVSVVEVPSAVQAGLDVRLAAGGLAPEHHQAARLLVESA